VLLIGSGLLSLAALIIHGAPLLDQLRAFVLGAVGYGWPLVLGTAIAAGVLTVWPEPPMPRSKPRLTLDDDDEEDAGGGGQKASPSRRFQPRPPSGLEMAAAGSRCSPSSTWRTRPPGDRWAGSASGWRRRRDRSAAC
jgi:hypothetical protein